MPKFESREEYERWKAEKIEESKDKAHKIKIAEEIVRHTPKSEIHELFEEKAPSKPFIEQLSGIFSYPLTGGGKYILITGTLFFGILSWLADIFIIVPIYGWIFAIMVGIFIGGILSSYVMKIITYTADGDNESPDWPEISDPWGDILSPFFKIFWTIVICFAPSLVYFFIIVKSGHGIAPLFWILFLLGLLYLPMSLIAMSMLNTLRSLNPFLIIPSIIKIPLDYIIACAVLLLIVGLRIVTDKVVAGSIPFVGSILAYLLFLYFLMIEARILGLIYNANKNKLNWFGEGG